MKLVYMGNSSFGIPLLEKLAADAELKPTAVVTNPPKPMGRGRVPTETPISDFSRKFNIPLIQPYSLKDKEFQKQLKALKPDLLVVVAFKILPNEIINIPKMGALNLHTSLLPLYRGAAPIQRALMDGKKETGVTTFIIEPKVDTGAILLSEKVPIGPDMNYGELAEVLSVVGSRLVIESIQGIFNKTLVPVTQDNSMATAAPKIYPGDLAINWDQPAEKIHDHVRALSPTPGAYTILRKKRFKILKTELESGDYSGTPGEILYKDKTKLLIGTKTGPVSILEIQKEGGKKLPIDEFLKGFQNPLGEKFKII